MRLVVLLVLALAAMSATAACSQTPASPEYVVPLVSTAVKTDSPMSSTHLAGDQENPPRDTEAQGQAILKVADDGLSVSFMLIASNIDNIVASHIHIAAPGVNGP